MGQGAQVWVGGRSRYRSCRVRAHCGFPYGPPHEHQCSLWTRLFFVSSRRRHTRYIGDWSSDVCSSDLLRRDLAARWPAARSWSALRREPPRSCLRHYVVPLFDPAPAASSSRSRCFVASSIVSASARPSEPSSMPRVRQASSGQRYAPRPGALPRRSTESLPSASRTTRMSSRFALTCRHATHVRCGTALTTILLLLAAEQGPVFVFKLVLVRRQRLGFDLGDEVVADRLLVLFDSGGGGLGFHHDRLRLRLGLGLRPDLGLAADVDAPAGELRREPRVLALLADRKGQVPVGHDDVRGLLIDDDVHPDDRGRREGVLHELLGLLVVLDDLHALAAELIADRLHPQAALPDARPDRIESGLP